MPSEASGFSIVVVDDAPANLILLANILEEAGHEVRVANSGQRALTLIERQPPDLVLLDVNLPDQDGYQVCRELKSKDALRSIPVIFLSADDNPEAKSRALEAGGAEYLVKPFEAGEVLARIALHLQLARALSVTEMLRAEAARWEAQARTTFAALCAVLPGSTLEGSYRLSSPIEGEEGSARFRATRIADGADVIVEVRPNGSSAFAETAPDGTIETSVSVHGLAYRVLPTT